LSFFYLNDGLILKNQSLGMEEAMQVRKNKPFVQYAEIPIRAKQ
jgi:hypothetical protein